MCGPSDIKASLRAMGSEMALIEHKRLSTGMTPFEVLEQLREASEPRLIRKLIRHFNRQSGDLSQRDIEEMIAAGRWAPVQREAFRQAYSEFVSTDLAKEWGLAYNTGGRSVFTTVAQLEDAASFGDLVIPLQRSLDQWVAERSTASIQNITDMQGRAISTILRRHIIQEPLSPRNLSVLLRAVIGLDERQAQALATIRSAAAANGVTGARLTRLVERNRSRMVRNRATRIARTEIATAYNEGTRATVERAFEGDPNTLNAVVMVWQTSEDERVCPICGPLNNKPVGFTSTFDVTTRSKGVETTRAIQTPPAHPMCRCTLLYVFPEDRSELALPV